MIGFRKSHAVVIGIDEYGEGIPPLRTAVNDARRIAQVLETGYGYTVHLLTEDVSLGRAAGPSSTSPCREEVEADDRLLVYFAGHGIALDGDDGPAGYLVPQDARREDRGSFLPMTELNGWLERLPCRHLLLVLDCCFAGAFRWSSTRDLGALAGGHPPRAVRPLHQRPGLAGHHVGRLRPEGPRRPLGRDDRRARPTTAGRAGTRRSPPPSYAP